MKVLLANGTEYTLLKGITKELAKVNNTYIPSIKLYITGDLSSIKDDFKDEEKTSLITFIDEEKRGTEYSGYQKLVSIGYSPDDSTETGSDVYTVTMALTDDVKELVKTWSKQLEDTVEKTNEATRISVNANETSNEAKNMVKSLIPNTNIDTMTVEEAKAFKIAQSKEELEKYLQTHPITSTCHGDTEGIYSIVSEKQQYLVSMIAVAEMAISSGIEYQPSWNESGKACTYDWTVDELKQLAFEMEQVVRPLVSKQQTIETEIKNCSTIEEIKEVVISYE